MLWTLLPEWCTGRRLRDAPIISHKRKRVQTFKAECFLHNVSPFFKSSSLCKMLPVGSPTVSPTNAAGRRCFYSHTEAFCRGHCHLQTPIKVQNLDVWGWCGHFFSCRSEMLLWHGKQLMWWSSWTRPKYSSLQRCHKSEQRPSGADKGRQRGRPLNVTLYIYNSKLVPVLLTYSSLLLLGWGRSSWTGSWGCSGWCSSVVWGWVII